MKLKLTEELWKEGNLEEAQKIGTLEVLLQEAGFDENQGYFFIRKELVGFSPIEVAI